MQEEYDRVMKLHMGGKITEKNVFSLNINMSKYLFDKYNRKNQKIDFQRAALDIDAGQKIISCMIDGLHKETTQAAKDLMQKNNEVNDEEDQNEAEDGESGNKKKKKRKKGEVIATDISKISEFKLKEKKDPYLFVRATKLDSATGLPDLKCSISDICCDSAGIAPNEETKVIDGTEDDFEIEKDTFKDWLDFNDSSAEKPVITDIKQEWNQVWRELAKTEDIAPTFSRQEFSDELTTPVEINQKNQNYEAMIEPVTFEFNEPDPVDDDPFDSEAPTPESNTILQQDDFLPAPPSVHENEDDIASNFGDTAFFPSMPTPSHKSNSNGWSEFASKTPSTSSNQQFDKLYGSAAESLLNELFDSTMVFRKPRIPPRPRIMSDAEKSKSRIEKVKPKKNTKKTLKMRENDVMDLSSEVEIDFKNILKSKIRSRKLDTSDPRKFIRIENEDMEPVAVRFYAGLRKIPFPRKYAYDEPEETSDEHGPAPDAAEDNDEPFQTDHHSDIGDMFIQNEHVSSDENEVGFGDLFNETGDMASQEEVELPVPKMTDEVDSNELIRVKQVEKIKMKFDRRARRVNVKLVKKEMKNLIETHKDNSICENEENEENGSEVDFIPATTFTDMQQELQSVLTGEDKDNLTPAMALVCVLYLANEENLELEQTTDRDFIIKAPNTPSQKPTPTQSSY
jgi:hypothetical protein